MKNKLKKPKAWPKKPVVVADAVAKAVLVDDPVAAAKVVPAVAVDVAAAKVVPAAAVDVAAVKVVLAVAVDAVVKVVADVEPKTPSLR
jgi:hypothetical protein